MKRIDLGVFALIVVLGFSGTAHPQVICSKTNNKGKVKFKLRDACKSNEVVSQDFAGFRPTEVVTASDLPAAPGELATTSDLAGLATAADVEAIPRVRVLGFVAEGFQGGFTGPLRIDDNGSGDGTTAVVSTASASATLHITFSAECSLSSAAVADFVNLDLIVDGNVIAPTGVAGAFCHSEGTMDFAFSSTHSTTVVASGLAPGSHTLEAVATVAGPGSFSIGNVSVAAVVID